MSYLIRVVNLLFIDNVLFNSYCELFNLSGGDLIFLFCENINLMKGDTQYA